MINPNFATELRLIGWRGAEEEAPKCFMAIKKVIGNIIANDVSLRDDYVMPIVADLKRVGSSLEVRQKEMSHLSFLVKFDSHDALEAYGLLRGFEGMADLASTAVISRSFGCLNVFKKYDVPLPVLSVDNFAFFSKFDYHFAQEIVKIYPPNIIHPILEAAVNYEFYASQPEFLASLIRSCPDINRFCTPTRTLLHIAAATNNLFMARLLLENGANPNAQTEQREKTPIATACTIQMINLLFDNGAIPSLPYTVWGFDYPNGLSLTHPPFPAGLRERIAMHRLD